MIHPYMQYRENFLKEEYPFYYQELIAKNQLNQHLSEVRQRTEEAIQKQIEILNKKYIYLRLEMTESQYNNYLYKTAEEIVLNDIVYQPIDTDFPNK